MVFKKDRATTAIDISDGYAKIIAISGDKDVKALSVLDVMQLSKNTEKEVAKEIRSLISKNKLGGSHILVSFPRHLVTVRNVRLPTSNGEEVKNMVELQAIRYIPYSQEEIIVSHKVIDVTKEGYTDVLLVLAQRKLVNRYVEIFKYAGFSIEKLALSSEGILNWYRGLNIDDTAPVALIDFGRRHTHIQIVKERKLLFSRSVSFNIADPGSDKEAILREIKLSLDSFSKEADEGASRVVLTGAEDYSKDILPFLSDNLSLSCEFFGQLFRDLKVTDSAAKSLHRFKDASYTSLLGIAIRPDETSVNLLPRDVIDKKKETALKNELTKSALLFLAVAVAGFGIIERNMIEKRSYLAMINTRLQEIEPEVKRLLKFKQDIELIRGQLMLEGSAISIIREIYEILPEDVSLTLFEFEDKDRVLLRGTTQELSKVFSLLPLLEKSPYFENVKINYATKRTFKNKDFADFEIICSLR